MTTNRNKLNWYYYRQLEGCNDMSICQYLRLDYLIQLLETGRYYVKRRKFFEDANESHINLKYALVHVPVGKNDISHSISFERIIPSANIIDCPTSCWSKNVEEKFLMWKCYATDMGACIRTTVHNFIASLQIDLDKNSENKVVCGSMDYKNVRSLSIEEYMLFDKDKAYDDEKEFRFYFYFPTYDTDKNATGIFVPVDTQVMIDNIVLSPFISKDAAEMIAKQIVDIYGIDVIQSIIKIK